MDARLRDLQRRLERNPNDSAAQVQLATETLRAIDVLTLAQALPAEAFQRANIETLSQAAHEHLAETIDPETIAGYIDASDVADYIEASDVACYIDVSDVADYIDTDSVAETVAENFSASDVADHIDVEAVAEYVAVDPDDVSIDLDDLAQRVAKLLTLKPDSPFEAVKPVEPDPRESALAEVKRALADLTRVLGAV